MAAERPDPSPLTWIGDERRLARRAGGLLALSFSITGLAFDSPEVSDDAKLGILAASTIAAVLGSLVVPRANPAIEIEAPEDDPVESA